MKNQERQMICIMCPMGCKLTIKNEDKKIIVSGNSCIRGEIFAKEEISCPKRIVTTSVKTNYGVKSCKTTGAIAKDKIFDCIAEIEKLKLDKVEFGQIVIKNILNTGVDVVITANE